MIRPVLLACVACLLLPTPICEGQKDPKANSTNVASPQRLLASQSAPARASADRRLIGTWGENMTADRSLLPGGGNLVYIFRADGTYRRILLVKGAIHGLATWDGYYSVTGDLLILHATRGSWKPMAEGQSPGYSDKPKDEIERKRIRMPDPQTLILFDEKLAYVADHLRKLPEP